MHNIKVGENVKSIARFFVSVKKEMKKVRWPKRKEMVKFSIATICIVCFFMAFFSLVDGILGAIWKVLN